MSNDGLKDTTAVDTTVVLNRLFDRLTDEVRRNQAETREAFTRVDGQFAEIKSSVNALQTSDKSLFEEVQRQGKSIAELTERVGRVENETARAHLRVSKSDEERSTQVEAWKAHSRQLESSMGQLSANDAKLLSNDAKQDKALAEQTVMLGEIKTAAGVMVKLAKSPRVAAYVAVGAVLGGVIAGIITKAVH